ncbi:response regulator transcription factor [Dehalococcoides sp. THU3]|uniref:response regulator transcription factor n=1 Tax=Dehalococcoides TaxID=61434 RepID=UPI0005B56D37|nr:MULTISPECIES: response regulator transcription factor [Dehalococcoides]QYY58775.1 response regulator transcription factor [Dehalococcoides mccartyi]BAQ35301.1 two-component response regulator [Dehalococcoides sp. UCH007]
MKLLFIEDDKKIVESIFLLFKSFWPDMETKAVYLGKTGIETVYKHDFDIAIIDLGLPDIDGINVLKQIRAFSSLPILILTARNNEQEIFTAFELGADDYITKPFQPLELIARVKSLLKRLNRTNQDLGLKYGHWKFGTSLKEISYKNNIINLTITEGQLLHILLTKGGRIVSYADISKSIWGRNEYYAKETIKTHIMRIRQKLSRIDNVKEFIINIPGVGYQIIE